MRRDRCLTRNKPVLLDLFCGGGGATRGYQNSGFYVVGVDINPQPDYCGDRFIQGDAVELLDRLVSRGGGIFSAVHASPPCQASCTLTKGTNIGKEYEQLIPAVRHLLGQLPIPTVIENVQGSDLRRDLTLCGEMFGLEVIRHRYFECSFDVVKPQHIPHRGRVSGYRHGVKYDGPYFAVYGTGGDRGTVADWQRAMGIDWTSNRKTIAEAIPPAYAEYVGRQILGLTHHREELIAC